MHRVAEAIGAEDASTGMWHLAKSLGGAVALRDIGMKHEGIERAVELATTAAYPDPRPLEADALRGLLEHAFAGEPPRIDGWYDCVLRDFFGLLSSGAVLQR